MDTALRTMTRRRALGLLAGALGLAACTPARPSTTPAAAPASGGVTKEQVAGIDVSKRIPARLTWGSAISSIAWVAAVENKIADKYGLDVSLVSVGGGPEINEAMIAGRLDVGSNGVAPAVSAWASGLKTHPIGVNAQGADRYTILATRASGIGSIEELRGKKIAVQKGTDPEAAFYAAGKAHGLNLFRDAEVLDIKWNDQAPVLARNDVQAAGGNEPQSTAILNQLKEQVVLVERLGKYYSAGTFAMVRDEWSAQHPDGDKRLALALWEGQKWVRENPERASELAQKHYKLKPEEVADSMQWFDLNPIITEGVQKDLETAAEMLVEQNKIREKPDFKSLLASPLRVQEDLRASYGELLPAPKQAG